MTGWAHCQRKVAFFSVYSIEIACVLFPPMVFTAMDNM